jgi:hypothetical protein
VSTRNTSCYLRAQRARSCASGLLKSRSKLTGCMLPKIESLPLSTRTTSSRESPTLERVRPDIRPQLREFLAWYDEVLGRIEAGAVVAPGEQERLTEEASAVAHLLDLLDSSADEPAS